MSKPTLTQLLAESARNVQQERDQELQLERITRDVKARLTPLLQASHKRSPEAEGEQGECPRCGYTAPLDDFDNGPDESGDDFSPDDVTGESGADDSSNDRLTNGKVREGNNGRAIDRLAALQRAMREANQK